MDMAMIGHTGTSSSTKVHPDVHAVRSIGQVKRFCGSTHRAHHAVKNLFAKLL
jgi:hypothetical protein